MQKITPFLWFNTQAEEAVHFYVSLFKNSKIESVARYDTAGAKAAGRKKDSVMTISFKLNGQNFTALNGGPTFSFSPAISFLVNCVTQEEIDGLWSKLSRDGNAQPCGWVTDKYGVTWQIVPRIMGKLMTDKDPVKSQRVMMAMLQMEKLDIENFD
jgi:predicted 3-demethylubiquinone-9 3-methyltransferase (glyoxalase superfamily)